ncbi:hypothetical protein DOTSEDRAFT_19837 [Dothistroma septosporum NZE10]|uniref:Uncharacterized protein n=1 Tax=Dothistroma septosporum (strain NZE10 / CBS 128990) TaxID=675120 RepID=N1Q3W5_DOTSN|nr:hypothetical protein DOTSEDRAFT_19837 [Dothistroma septosporum NZE10]
MANNKTTYMTIPPPPLPEFYLPRVENLSTHDTDSRTEVPYAVRYERARELARAAALPGDGIDERVSFAHTRATDAPLQHSVKRESGAPPLAVYHICRVCLRPRSARYHQEHPIPEDGLPPPPGICRRCRVTPAEEVSKVTQVVEEHDSNDIKLGVRALVPGECYYSSQDMREKRAEYLLRHAEWQEIEPSPRREEMKHSRHQEHNRVDILAPPTSIKDSTGTQRNEYTYRHFHVAVPPPPPQSIPVSPEAKEHFHRHIYIGVAPPPLAAISPKSRAASESTAKDAMDVVNKHSSRTNLVSKEAKAQYKQWQSAPPPSPPPSPMVSTGPQKVTDKIVAVGSTMREQPISTTSQQKPVSQHNFPHKTVPSEAEIRRLARDEVVRYRRAERKLEAHIDPYAHGKMVPLERMPVERRIETVRDIAEEKPWIQRSESIRRDSGVAVKEHAWATSYKQDRQEVLLSHATRQDSRNIEKRQQRAASPTTDSSSVASAKDDGPPRTVKRPVRGGKSVSEVQGIALDCSERQPGPQVGVRRIVLPARNGDIVEFSEHWNEAERATKMRSVPVRKDNERATASARDFDRVRQTPADVEHPESMGSKLTSQGYWNKEQVASKAAEQSMHTVDDNAEKLPMKRQDDFGRRDPLESDRQTTSRDTQIGSYQRQSQGFDRRPGVSEATLGKLRPPYPQEDAVTSMPSPRSHISNHSFSLAKEAALRDGGKEWMYVRRTVQPADRSWDEHVFDDGHRPDLDYKETRERFARRKLRQECTRPITPPSKRRPSDASSRVRFSSKLDVSPTPPDSDASSSEFRRGGMMKHQHNSPAPNKCSDVAVEEADRGRSRSRTVTPGERGYYYERDTIRTREREYHETDRDRTPRPSDRGRRRSGTSDTGTGLGTMPSDIRPLARAFSESPSRETLREAARRQKLQQKPDSKGPYTTEYSRSDSVEAFDGSTVTSSSRSGSRREHRVHRKEGGRSGRR